VDSRTLAATHSRTEAALPDYSLGTGWTPVEDVIDAARRLGVLAGVTGGDGTPEHREVLVTAHDGRWTIHRDRASILGWVAARLDPQGWPVPGTLGWLGASDLPGERVVRALLDSEILPTDLHLREPGVPTAHPMRQDRPSRAACSWVAQPDSASHAVTGPNGAADLTLPVQARCGVCGHLIADARGHAVPRDQGQHACSRCDQVTPGPAEAARVHCDGCGLHVIGSGLTADERGQLAETERRRAAAQRARVTAARHDPAR
jgi:5-methylcytosine-specific restriction endonuclease McrA